MNNLEFDRMAAIEATCYRAISAMVNEMKNASGGQLTADPTLMLIAALEVIESERKKRRPGFDLLFNHQDVINYLQRMTRAHIQSKALRKRQTQP